MSLILGIDPGANTGVATYVDGQLTNLETFGPHQLEHLLRTREPTRVIFEDSRLQSHVFSAKSKLSVPARLKVARDVGEIDAWCSLITAVCAELGISAHGISPQGKGAKLNAAQFASVTSWVGKSNEHTRDAAMVAWKYRGART